MQRIRKVITAVDVNGNTFAEIHHETKVGNRWYPEDPVPLDEAGPEAKKWKDDFGAAQQAELKRLRAELEDKNGKVLSLEAEVAKIPSLKQAAANAESSLAAVTAERDELRERIKVK